VHDWHYAAWHAVASRNRLASRRVTRAEGGVDWRSPEELFFGGPATFKHHVAFAARCRVLLVGARAQARGTLSQRAVLGRVYLWGGHGLQVRGVFRYVLGYVVRCDDGSLVHSRDVWVNENDLVAVSVLSGNRNFEGRISPDVRANYLASPPLVVA
jgi:hypothetical protein